MLICRLWFETLSQFRWSRNCAVTLSRWPCLLHPFVIGQSKGGVKEPTLLFEKSSGSFHGGVVYLSRITHHSYHGLWVGYSKLIDGLIAAATGALVCWSPSFNVVLLSTTLHYITLHCCGTITLVMKGYSVIRCIHITSLVVNPWLHTLSSRSHKLAISVFSSTPETLASACPRSTASCPIFCTRIFFTW